MFSKSTFVLAFFAIAKLATATPPACLLAAINTQDDPSKVSDICKSSKMEPTIISYCGDNTQQALSDFASVCKGVGVTVSSAAPSASGTLSAKSSGTASKNATTPLTTGYASSSIFVYTTASYDSACSCTKTAAITATALSGPTGVVTSGTATGTGALAVSTGAAGKNEMGRLAAVAVVVGGLFAAL
ncbi:hypothetical protein AOQ84DRAFT_351781 [Glonium stellatum]|uniref:GPI anchored cell wall protein n=1 Tax=Glonium stellatum TaxID=574774 RepID=A0A8E2FBD9_9PEZI|nr:hypothetical protein AOQ84DRAFT_351781 [Glonium stellatum]